jgi:hypothetical protein
MHEGEVGNEGRAGTVRRLSRPIILILHTLERGLAVACKDSKTSGIERLLTIPFETLSPTISLTTSQEVTPAPIPCISC